MDHKEASGSHAAERYILSEMSATQRDHFEEHYFECGECARDVQALEVFQANAKVVFEDRARTPMVGGTWHRRRGRQFGALAASLALATGALTIYQNLVTIPRLNQVAQDSRSVQPIEFIAASPATRGARDGTIVFTVGSEYQDIALAIPLEPGWDYPSYRVAFQPECGPVADRGRRELPAPGRGVPLHLRVPAAGLDSGTCRLSLEGLSSDAGRKDLGMLSFRINKTQE